MGAWGDGPFDSDGSLDFIGDVAYQTSTRDEETFDIVPGTVNYAEAERLLGEALVAVTVPPAKGEYRQSTCENAYAAAGLVAAVRAGHTADTPSGTRLFANLAAHVDGSAADPGPDPLGLGAHCGYVALLNDDAVTRLLPLAVAAVGALRVETGYRDIWLDPQAFDEQLERLAAALQ